MERALRAFATVLSPVTSIYDVRETNPPNSHLPEKLDEDGAIVLGPTPGTTSCGRIGSYDDS